MQLRPYQRECLQSLVGLAKEGVKRQLVAIPTGTGKTVVFSQIPAMAQGRRMLVLAHRTELIQQAAASIRRANPELEVGVEQAKDRALPEAQVVVASVQTLAVSPERLELLRPDQFGVVVVDEAHHSIAKTYMRIFNRFGLCLDPDQIEDNSLTARKLSAKTRSLFQDWGKPEAGTPYLFGFTATPHRTDGVGLEWIFDEIAYSRTIKEMIREGWLCDVRGVQIPTATALEVQDEKTGEMRSVDTRRGDYVEHELSSAVNVQHRNETAVNSYLALAPDRQAVCFCVDVAHTEAMTAAFREAGVKVGMVVGETPKEERAATLASYQRGDLRVLVNCLVLTEGWDSPQTSCLIMARPTKSSLMYTQCLGRGTRLAPGKDDLLVIDLVDIGAAGVSTVNTLFGLPPKLALTEQTVTEAEDELGDLFDKIPMDSGILAEALSVADVLQRAREADPLEAAALPDWLHHTLTWVRTSYGYALDAGNGITLGVVVNTLGQGTVRVKVSREKAQTIDFGQTEQEAISKAEAYVKAHYADQHSLLNRNARWRHSSAPATQKQLDYLRWLRADIPAGCTKGQAAMLITLTKSGKVAL
jgi:ATP-dependent helicase IRC3